MKHTRQRRLRMTAAVLLGLSGLAHVIQLWFEPLSEATLLRSLLGVAYLFICIGLLGLSRTSLVLATIVPATTAVMLTHALRDGSAIGLLSLGQLSIDVIVAGFSAWVLYLLRHRPRL